MIELNKKQLVFRFPEVHEDAVARVEFQRTLRIPDDGQEYPLPAGLGQFPLAHVDDFDNAPDHWKTRGGVLMPVWQAEATWLRFSGTYPMAFKVAAGKINAITGNAWANPLVAEPQDYLVSPEQPWLDGFCVGDDLIRQFVAMPLGEGFTAEEKITGKAEFGGLQIIAFPMRGDNYEAMMDAKSPNWREEREMLRSIDWSKARFSRGSRSDMGMAPGGLMRQEIYDDAYGIDAWEHSVYSRCFVHLANAVDFKTITGALPPEPPPSAKDYAAAGLPWYDYYRADLQAVGRTSSLSVLDSLASVLRKKHKALADNEPVTISETIQLADKRKQVRQDW